jgi:hypothetical protein
MLEQDQSRAIGRTIEHLLQKAEVQSTLDMASRQALEILEADSTKLAGSVSISLEVFGPELPPTLLSCRLSVMKAGAAYHLERHPNAIQYVYSLENGGSISIYDDGIWRKSELDSDASTALETRWHMVPANTWHQPVPGEKNWTVLAFHTASPPELVDDYNFLKG